MDALGTYILSVTSASILYSVLHSLVDKKSSASMLLQLIGGLFLTFTVIAPVSDLDFGPLFDSQWKYISQGNSIVDEGKQFAQEQIREIIKQRCEAYILDKAMTFQTPIRVEVSLDRGETSAPTSVKLEGSIPPYIKRTMQQWLQDEMGIPRENQIWTD